MTTRGTLHKETAAPARWWQRAVPAGKNSNSPSPTRGQTEQDNIPKETKDRRGPPLRQPWHTGVGGGIPQRRLAANTARRRHRRGAAAKARGTPHRVSATAAKAPHTGGGGRTPPAKPGGRRAGVSRGVPIVPPGAANLPAIAGRPPMPANDAEERRRCSCQMGATARALATKSRRPWVSQSDATKDRAHLVGSEAATSAPG